jgi:uncharacterized membrane protein YecN with MAPEG domain
MPTALDPALQTGPILVTLACVALYYVLQLNVARTKLRLHREYAARGERFDRYFGQDRVMLAADRAQLNLLEHMPPFLALLWLNAVFVDPLWATVAGGVYMAARVAHPFALGARLARDIRPTIGLATAPGYLVLAAFAAALVWRLLVANSLSG